MITNDLLSFLGEMSPGWIVYLLRPGTNVTEDHFVFKVTDPGKSSSTVPPFPGGGGGTRVLNRYTARN